MPPTPTVPRRPAVPAAPDVAYDPTVHTELRVVGPDLLRVRATLVDDTYAPGGFQPVHDMTLEADLTFPELEVVAVGGDMDSYPHGTCPGTLGGLGALVGVRVQAGFLSELRRRLGGDRGCNHLHTLAQHVGTVAALSYAAHMSMTVDGLVEAPPDDFFDAVLRSEPGVVGSCAIWREDGELVQRLRRRGHADGGEDRS